MSVVIVSRHSAAIVFIAQQIVPPATPYVVDGGQLVVLWDDIMDNFPPLESNIQYAIPILASATEEDVRDKVVYGNLPLHLAAAAQVVFAIEFEGDPPRGAEYTLEDMRRAGAVLRCYQVRRGVTETVAQGCNLPNIGQPHCNIPALHVVTVIAPSDCDGGMVVYE